MADASKKYIKVYCPVSKCYGLVTAEQNNGVLVTTNFYEIDKNTAENIQTEYGGALPPVSSNLKACASCGKRVAGCCNKKSQCSVPKGELWYQCLYCKALEICKPNGSGGGADIYFLMDQSGSMSDADRREGVRAVKKLIQSLTGSGNTYSFVAWGSNAGYLFKQETNSAKISLALASYESGNTPYGGMTAAHLALDYIYQDVHRSHAPVRIIFVTDGYFDSFEAALSARNRLLSGNKNIEILAIGIEGADSASLSAIGTVKSFSKVIGGSSALLSTFEEIAKKLRDGGNNF